MKVNCDVTANVDSFVPAVFAAYFPILFVLPYSFAFLIIPFGNGNDFSVAKFLEVFTNKDFFTKAFQS